MAVLCAIASNHAATAAGSPSNRAAPSYALTNTSCVRSQRVSLSTMNAERYVSTLMWNRR